uniref:Uncharacterized protein n=1 Tax=Magallana gigas TaxID=29159 RepID=K1QV94_MAGGI
MPPKPAGKTVKTTASKGGTAAKPAKAAAPKSTTKTPAKPAATAKPAEAAPAKPPEHKITVKELAAFVLQDADNIVKNSKWFPMMIDPSEISGRFLQYRECTFINGLDHEFINSPDRIRIATLAALSIKKLIRPTDDDLYSNILQFGMKDDFGFVIITKNEDTNGFTDKMMTVRVES